MSVDNAVQRMLVDIDSPLPGNSREQGQKVERLLKDRYDFLLERVRSRQDTTGEVIAALVERLGYGIRAIFIRFHGQPANHPPRYTHQILGHLIAEAQDVAAQTGVPLLLLYVHEQNARARRLYEQFDFTADTNARDDHLVLMTHRLIA